MEKRKDRKDRKDRKELEGKRAKLWLCDLNKCWVNKAEHEISCWLGHEWLGHEWLGGKFCELNAWQVNAGRNPVLLAVAPIVDKSSGRANLGLVGSRMHFWPQMQISFGYVRILFPFPFCRVSQLLSLAFLGGRLIYRTGFDPKKHAISNCSEDPPDAKGRCGLLGFSEQ